MFHAAGRCLLLGSLTSIVVLFVAEPFPNAAGYETRAQDSSAQEGFQSLDDIVRYISVDWDRLTRSLDDCSTFLDTKTTGDRVLYLPAEVEVPPALLELRKRCSVRIERLPAHVQAPASQIGAHGLLYLEHPYVVPGGQFNEMYGWDSYFIIRGLLRDGRNDLAKGMIENFFYEIEHYGRVLNANRTYYLGRSQPPFLSSMIVALYDSDESAGKKDLQWLEKAYRFAVLDHDRWTREPHLAGDTTLSRYFDEGEGPVPEIARDPDDYYRGVVHYFLMHGGEDNSHLIRVDAQHPAASVTGSIFQVYLCDPGPDQSRDNNCVTADRVALSADAYKGDRSMRESGFDVSFRFGPFGVDTHHYAPVCLNTLLYKTEKDLEKMSSLLGRPQDARRWQEKALARRAAVNKYLWDASRGLFFDYDFVNHKQSAYEYATAFYPLWAGLATDKQARAVASNLALFEQPGGLAMSRHESQAQWDYPYGWAPIHLLAIEGLRRYGHKADAERLTYKFLSMVLENFRRDHTIREKYDVVSRSTLTHVDVGYAQNVTGFGWTNGVFLELLHNSSPELVARLRKD